MINKQDHMLSKRIKKHPILAFFTLALLISWAGWIPYAAAKSGMLKLDIPSEIIWIAEFGPSFSAILITLLIYGSSELKNLLRGLFVWRVNIKWYVLAILTIPMLILFSIGLDVLIAGTSYDFSQLQNWDTNFINRTQAFTPSMGLITGLVDFMKTGTLATGITFLLLALTNGGLSEEIGWRGFALTKFQNKPFNLLLSSLFVSLLWSAWHTGTAFWQTIMTASLLKGAYFTFSYLLQYLILVFPLSIIYTILYNGTKGSILLAILFHGLYNISISVFATALDNFPMVTFIVVLWLFSALLLLIFWKNPTYNKSKILANN